MGKSARPTFFTPNGDTHVKCYFRITRTDKMYTIEALKDGAGLVGNPDNVPGMPEYIAAEGDAAMLKRHSPPTSPVPIELVISWIQGFRRFRCTTQEMVEEQ